MLELRSISKQFRTARQQHWALQDVSFQLQPGLTALIGPNGGGKSTLMSIATTLETPTSGELLYGGQHLKGKALESYRRIIGYVPQHIRFVGSMTTTDVLEYMGWVHGLSKSERSQRSITLLEQFGIGEKRGAKASSLSGGQLRRLGLAAAMVAQPEILFLDEPTVGLDPNARLQVREIINELATSTSILISTHLVEDIKYLSGGLLVLADGQLVYNGTYAELAQLVPEVSGSIGSSFEVAYSQIINEVKNHA